MAESVHKKLSRVRPPRVNITYEVHTGDAIEKKELPFVMGVLANLSGSPAEPLKAFKDRQFVEVNPDNFDEVLASMNPHLQFTVSNKLSDDEKAGNLAVALDFKSLDDFSPDRVGAQVPALKKLLDLRQELADLRGSLQGNDKLEDILQSTLLDQEKLDRLKSEMKPEGGSDGED